MNSKKIEEAAESHYEWKYRTRGNPQYIKRDATIEDFIAGANWALSQPEKKGLKPDAEIVYKALRFAKVFPEPFDAVDKRIICEAIEEYGDKRVLHAYPPVSEESKLREAEWVSVEERLPEAETGVLTVDSNDGFMSIAWIDGDMGGWVDNISGHAKGITHWMPLPLPPKAGLTDK